MSMFGMIVRVHNVHPVQVYNLFYLKIRLLYSDIRLGAGVNIDNLPLLHYIGHANVDTEVGYANVDIEVGHANVDIEVGYANVDIEVGYVAVTE